ncbi:MAG: DUF1573 domain-containing protein [Verrucomicrobia bacterium]|nr:MAG: DUF1573 domain-containing protein [Verrucomicrobiota bacterium]
MHTWFHKARLLACAVAGFLAAASASGLEWKQQHIRIKAAPADESATAVFAFTNNGDQPVTIKHIRSSCGCTVPTLERDTYAPGESGEIRAVFTFGGRTGRQTKTIYVETDEDRDAPYRLTLEVEIPLLFSVDRYFVIWRQGEQPTEKTITLTAHDPETATIAGVESTDDRVSVRLEPAGAAGTFTLHITPKDTRRSLQAPIVVRTNFPETHPRVITVYALIR